MATVTPSDAAGMVTFYDGASILGTSAISAGRAVFLTRQATGGARSFRACYSGDGAHRACSALAKDSLAPAVRLEGAGKKTGSPIGYLISTISGAGLPPTSMPATSMLLPGISALAIDPAGNLYFSAFDAVFRMDSTGAVVRVAGTGTEGFSGDNGPAILAQLYGPSGLAIDALGNLYIGDSLNGRVRKVSPAGTITTVAGGGICCSLGDGGPATIANIHDPGGLAIDRAGNLYITEMGGDRVRVVNAAGIISTVAGNGTPGYSGDNGSATSAQLQDPIAVAVDGAGNVFIADEWNSVVRKVSPAGIITTVAGNGQAGFSGDGQPATSAELNFPSGVAIDASGNLWIDDGNCLVREVGTDGNIATVAGINRYCGYSGDGGLAVDAQLSWGSGLAFDASGNLYIGDAGNQRIRRISRGIITTVVGGGLGSAAAAPFASFISPTALARDSSGNIFVADKAMNLVQRIAPDGSMSTVAGTGIAGYSGDNIPATYAQLNYPVALAVDANGDFFIADTLNYRVRKISNGIITTVAGNGQNNCLSGTPGQWVCNVWGVAVDSKGNLYFSDTHYSQIFKVSTTGAVSVFAGAGTAGYSGDNGAATAAEISVPLGLAFDSRDNLYIADSGNNRVREVSNGIISTVAGTGAAGFGGDSEPAIYAQLNLPQSVAVDSAGNIFVGDASNSRVREITVDGAIRTVAGYMYPGAPDGSPAIDAFVLDPSAVATDTVGNVYFADVNTSLVRLLTPQGGPPVLTMTSTHSGSFSLGSTGQYSLAVSNAVLAGPTNGTAVTVTEFAPNGLSIGGMSGDGWTCGTSTCTRSDSLPSGGSYPTITVDVNVLSTGPSQVTNQVTVGGGGAAGVLGAQDLTVLTAPATAIRTNPSGLLFSMDALRPETAPQSVLLSPGPHLIGVPSPQAGLPGSQYAFNGWSDSGAQTHAIDVAGAAATYTASFQTQYQLSSSVLPASSGSVSLASGSFFNAGSNVSVTAKGNAPYTFSYWSGAASGNANPVSIGMSAPQAVTANFISCDVNNDKRVDVADVQQIINEALGAQQATNDLNGDGVVNVIDVAKLIDAVMGFLY